VPNGTVTAPSPGYQELVYGQNDYRTRFGSTHTNGCNFVFCDGSVHTINYSVSNDVHGRLCNRCDGKTISAKVVD
jgi:prepilin-type processing-associated H-X9-DG protein